MRGMVSSDLAYSFLYHNTEFAAILLGVFLPAALLAVFFAVVEYFLKHVDKNAIKLAFYAALFLHATSRALIVIWVFFERDDFALYYDLPSLLLISMSSIVIYQVDKLFPASPGLLRRRIVLLLCNVVLYLLNFLYYMFNESLSPANVFTVSHVIEAFGLAVVCVVMIWSARSNWQSCRFSGENKLAGAFLCCLLCLAVRMAVVISSIFSSFSPHGKSLDSDTNSETNGETDEPMLSAALLYYGVGEAVVDYVSLYIQYLAPRAMLNPSPENASLTTYLLGAQATGSGKGKSLEAGDYYNFEDNPKTQEFKVITPQRAQVIKFLNLFEKSLNSTNVVLHEVLGKGGSGAIVHRCTLREGPFSGGTFAVKVMKDCVPDDLGALMNEVRIYQSLQHNHIVKFMGADLSSSREVRLFMEFIPQTLDLYIKKRTTKHAQHSFSTAQITTYMLQLVSGLDVLHSHNIIHRDLKTSNIFVVMGMEGEIAVLKIGDFDVSTFLSRDKPGSKSRKRFYTANKGTDSFRAPEMASPTSDKVHYDIKVDIWSMGMILYSFLTLLEPFEHENRFERGWDAAPTLPKEVRSNIKYRRLIRIFERCASPKPSDRPTCKEIAVSLQSILASL